MEMRKLGGRRGVTIAGAAVLAFAVIAPTAGYILTNSANAADDIAASAGAVDPLDGLSGRSPGERLFGIATKLAQRGAGLTPDGPFGAGDGDDPQQRALGQIFDEPPVSDDFAFAPLTTEPPLVGPEVFDPIGPGPGGGFSPGGPGGGFIPGGSSGGGSSGGGSSGGTTPPVPGIPEPGTWALMILGFGAVGASLRRRNRQVRLSPQA